MITREKNWSEPRVGDKKSENIIERTAEQRIIKDYSEQFSLWLQSAKSGLSSWTKAHSSSLRRGVKDIISKKITR